MTDRERVDWLKLAYGPGEKTYRGRELAYEWRIEAEKPPKAAPPPPLYIRFFPKKRRWERKGRNKELKDRTDFLFK